MYKEPEGEGEYFEKARIEHIDMVNKEKVL
jgi:hypothetical protein